MTRTKNVTALPLDERRKLLEAVAERAAIEYETDKELTTFTELDGAFIRKLFNSYKYQP
ncbi:MAG: hypothetical protein HW386_1687 [Gammaproteobacteria bacterium]|nr:hypothetical protein [Gammaproteobacteria bacterium]